MMTMTIYRPKTTNVKLHFTGEYDSENMKHRPVYFTVVLLFSTLASVPPLT